MSTSRRQNKIKLIQGQTTLDKTNNKKRRRSTGENNSISKRRNSIPDSSQVYDTADTDNTELDEVTVTMSNVHIESACNTSTMFDEIKKMEERLSEKITCNKDKEISELEERLNNNIRSMIDASIR